MNSLEPRVVITGLGVVAANACGLKDFSQALQEGRSGIRFQPKLKELGFTCQVGGIPQGVADLQQNYFSQDALMAMNSSMVYAGMAGVDCWRDAGFSYDPAVRSAVDWDTGAVIGTGIGGIDTMGEVVIPRVNAGQVRRMGSVTVEQTMASSVSACVAGALGLGGQVTTNSSACTTGTEAIIMAYNSVREGRSKRMIAGGSEGSSHYIWAGFDAMRVLARGFNERPEAASRPMSATATGFVPSSGAGLLMIESLDSAMQRGAKIYAEILGGALNCGGQRSGGSMTAPNPEGVVRCIRQAIVNAGIAPQEIEAINGHLTATMADTLEIHNWLRALECKPEEFPWISSTKSLLGHGLGAAGGIELVASVLQLSQGFIHGSANCEDLHPKLEPIASRVVHKTKATNVRILAKASFGFGDVNGCLLLKSWKN
jgi:3-oxoacyl-(acyl-carrier-protein) synthase